MGHDWHLMYACYEYKELFLDFHKPEFYQDVITSRRVSLVVVPWHTGAFLRPSAKWERNLWVIHQEAWSEVCIWRKSMCFSRHFWGRLTTKPKWSEWVRADWWRGILSQCWACWAFQGLLSKWSSSVGRDSRTEIRQRNLQLCNQCKHLLDASIDDDVDNADNDWDDYLRWWRQWQKYWQQQWWIL